ncbi:MAG: hypothetical protein ACRDNL_13970 [Spirillospora sp.]
MVSKARSKTLLATRLARPWSLPSRVSCSGPTGVSVVIALASAPAPLTSRWLMTVASSPEVRLVGADPCGGCPGIQQPAEALQAMEAAAVEDEWWGSGGGVQVVDAQHRPATAATPVGYAP